MWNLSEYQKHPRRLSDYLPWAAFIGPGVILNKDGSFQRTIRFRGPDTGSATPGELMAMRARLNNVLKRLGSGWCIHVEAARKSAQSYPKSSFPNSAATLIDQERRKTFIGDHCESNYFLTLTFLPPEDQVRSLTSVLIERPVDKAGISYRASYETFLGQITQIVNLLSGFMPEVTPLDDDQTLSYLHDCVSERVLAVKRPLQPFYLDEMLTDSTLSGGLSPKLGKHFIKTVSIRAYIGQTLPCLLDGLNELALEYRWVARYLPMDKVQATSHLGKLRRQWFAKRKGMVTLLKEAVMKQESRLEDSDSLNKAQDADAALQELGGDYVSFGHFTLTVTVWDENESVAIDKARAVQQVVDSNGIISQIESFNAVQAWLGSLPGHGYADVRRPLISSLNVCDLMPASSIWSGPARCNHLNGPALLQTRTAGSTPFRLSIYQGDVGHTLIVGPTGAGKSTLLNLLACQFLRYDKARVFIFDKGQSSRAMTYAMGGMFYPIGAEGPGNKQTGIQADRQASKQAGELAGGHIGEQGGRGAQGEREEQGGRVCFQPLARIDEEGELAWAQDWLLDLLVREGITVTPGLKRECWSALNNLKMLPVRQRTMTTLRNLVQDTTIRQVLESFTLAGPYGKLLDADQETLSDGDWLTFETEHLMHSPRVLLPVLTYLFHKLEERFNQGHPTLLILDEAWMYLTDSTFAARIREWLKVLRKKNVAVIFATQSLADIAESSIAPAIIESCLTRIFLPNAAALEDTSRRVYQSFGLNMRQLQILQSATPKRDYYLQCRQGSRLFQLDLQPITKAFCAAGSPEDQARITQVLEQDGQDGFVAAYLNELGIHEDYLQSMFPKNNTQPVR
ncbi:MAG: helicase HerA-like domain-containing protein [Phycisphaerae bacterium]